MNRLFIAVIAVVGVAISPGFSAEQPELNMSVERNPEEVVARVNATELKRKDLEVRVQRMLRQFGDVGHALPDVQRKQVELSELDQMISRELVLQQGIAHPQTNVEARVEAHMEKLKTQFGGADGLAKTLAKEGLTEARLRKDLREDLIVKDTLQQVVDQKVEVSAAEIQTFYDSQRDRFQRPETAHASHILILVPADATDKVKAEKRAKIDAIRERLKKGEKFADVAREVSEDTGSAQRGGDLGDFQRGQMVPEFEKAAFEGKLNELSDVITTQFGHHLLIVTDRQPSRQMTFDEVKGNIEQFLKQRKGTALVQDYVKGLQANAKIEKLLK